MAIGLISLSLFSCSNDTNKKKQQEDVDREVSIIHFNITVAPDLSNRVNPKYNPRPLSDTTIIDIIADDIYPRILTSKRKINQKDHFQIDFINKDQINAYNVETRKLDIDFSRFEHQPERIAFIRNDFFSAKQAFKNEFSRCYAEAQQSHYGSDIWTYLQSGLDEGVVKKFNSSDSVTFVGDSQFINKYRNVLILLTDGYIEAGIFGKGYDLSSKTIDQFRKAFLRSGDSDLEAFYKKYPDHQIKSVVNAKLKDLEILVLELNDRTVGLQGATVHPTDAEIMKLFWTDWLERSGAHRVEIHEKLPNRTKIKQVINSFLGV